MKRNKFGVPYRRCVLRLADGRVVTMDVGCEEDWGNVQPCLPDDCPDWETAVGWGNDADGHVQIVSVVDPETGRVWSPRRWAARCVWRWTTRYEVN